MNKIVLLTIIFSVTHIYAQTRFTILSLNVALLALTTKLPIVGTVKLKEVGIKQNKKRAQRIAQTIKELASKGQAPDIILFQEAFDTVVIRDDLYNPLQHLYPYHYHDTRAGRVDLGVTLSIGANSGLAIFSKYPITRTMLNDYTCFAGEGAFARKGLLGAEICIDDQILYVFTTHLQAGVGAAPFKWLEDKKLLAKKRDACVLDDQIIDLKKRTLTTQEVRRAELQQAKKWIKAFATDTTAPVILGGDLNIEVKNQHDITDVFVGVEILYNEQKSAPRTGSVWDMKRKIIVPGKRIDWLLIVRNPHNQLSGDAWIVDWFGPQHTDHLGYLGTFEYKEQDT